MTSTTSTPTRLVPLREGMFRMPPALGDPVHLLANRCQDCGETFFPKRSFCAACSSPNMAPVEMPAEGTVHSFTIVRQQLPGSAMTPPYAIVNVAFKGFPTVQTVVPGDSLDGLATGATVDLVLGSVMENEAGDTIVSFVARPRSH